MNHDASSGYLVGTSGFHYNQWRERFYPRGLSPSKWLEFYSEHFNTVELNNPFYRLPSEAAFNGWRNRTPPGFVFAVKVSRFITRLKKLHDSEGPLKLFLARAELLGDKLGPLLYQLPPSMGHDAENEAALEHFLRLLPSKLQHVFEFRNPSWFDDRTFDLLRRHHVAFCVQDMLSSPTPVVATADFAYVRFHGSEATYRSEYSTEELKEWAGIIGALGKDLKAVYIYFNNDANGYAVFNAKTLKEMLGGPVP